MKTLVPLVFLLAGSIGCGEPVSFYADDSKGSKSGNAMKAPPQPISVKGATSPSPARPSTTYNAPQKPPPAETARIQGKVTETMDSGGYTYAAVKTAGDTVVWTAGPQTALKVGDTLDVESRTEMAGFSSKTLNRTFDRIFFVSTFGANAVRAPSHHAAAKKQAPAVKDEPLINTIDALAKGTGGPADAYTVQNLFANASQLNGAQVTIAGKVVKFNSGIMGKNWLHIQDGTGNPAQNTHDITVTTQGTAKVGDSVTVKATVATNRDFGAGYSYPVILENAQITPRAN